MSGAQQSVSNRTFSGGDAELSRWLKVRAEGSGMRSDRTLEVHQYLQHLRCSTR